MCETVADIHDLFTEEMDFLNEYSLNIGIYFLKQMTWMVRKSAPATDLLVGVLTTPLVVSLIQAGLEELGRKTSDLS